MHALKDYYGMVRILEEFPTVRQTFNLVPSMMAQVAEYASGEARRPVSRRLALKPAESLTDAERAFLLRHSFYSDPAAHDLPLPALRRAVRCLAARRRRPASRSLFGAQEFRDLQMWSQLAWFDEEFQAERPGGPRMGASAAATSRSTTSAAWARSSARSSARCCRSTRSWPPPGRSKSPPRPTTIPFCRCCAIPISPRVAHPGVPLPPRFRYPEDARRQLAHGARVLRSSISAWRRSGCGPRKARFPTRSSPSPPSWASSGPPPIAACSTARSAARVPVEGLYRPYRWRQQGRQLGVIFRDHFLSDLIGFVYSKMDAAAAADDFLRRIRENCAGILAAGRDALVPIILDGENAWEYYDRNGRPFLRELYRRISEDPRMRAVTVSEALRAAGAGAARPHFSGLVDQRQFRRLDRRRGGQPGLDAAAARAPDLRCRRQRSRGAAPAGVRRTADRRRQRLVLVVRPGARFRQPRGVRPALSQPPGQRLPLPEPDAARGALAADPAHRRCRRC